MDSRLKTPPTYAVASVDNALRIALMLQLEGAKTVTEVAARIGVATSTAHRLLAMLVYRDFAVQGPDRAYRAGPVLEMAVHSQSAVSRLRAVGLPHLRRLVDVVDESANLTVRTGTRVRFVASVESTRALRVGSREGMVFPAHLTTGGLLTLADLDAAALEALYASAEPEDPQHARPNLRELRAELDKVRRNGFAVNEGRSERGVVAVGVPVHDPDLSTSAGLAVSIPSVRYDRMRLPHLVSVLRAVAADIGRDLAVS